MKEIKTSTNHTFDYRLNNKKPTMETVPTADIVYQGICTLFHNANSKEKEKANKWLEDFQKSVSPVHLFGINDI